jgi:hypothetical protein
MRKCREATGGRRAGNQRAREDVPTDADRAKLGFERAVVQGRAALSMTVGGVNVPERAEDQRSGIRVVERFYDSDALVG